MMNRSLIEINLLSGFHNFKIELFTHRFVGLISEASEPVYLDTWTPEKRFIHNADLYPDKISNLMGKELMLSSISYPPITVVQITNETTIYDGLEYHLIREWVKKINFTWKVLYEQDEWWGEIYENGSGYGLVGHLSMDLVDVSFTAIFLWLNESRFIDYRYCIPDIYIQGVLGLSNQTENLN